MVKDNKKRNPIPDCLWMKTVKICHLVTTNTVRIDGSLYEHLTKIKKKGCKTYLFVYI